MICNFKALLYFIRITFPVTSYFINPTLHLQRQTKTNNIGCHLISNLSLNQIFNKINHRLIRKNTGKLPRAKNNSPKLFSVGAIQRQTIRRFLKKSKLQTIRVIVSHCTPELDSQYYRRVLTIWHSTNLSKAISKKNQPIFQWEGFARKTIRSICYK